jgi:hypothetical protein
MYIYVMSIKNELFFPFNYIFVKTLRLIKRVTTANIVPAPVSVHKKFINAIVANSRKL